MLRWVRLLALVFAVMAAPLAAQSIMERLVTPGPLSNAHAKLEAKCDSCHESFSKGAQNSRCLSCHKGIASDVAAGAGFHGKFGNARTGQCKICHSDHKGRGFALIRFTRANFNHNLTDYPLTGGHARAQCAGCHGASTHYRGVSTACASCHGKKDPHKGQLGQACQSCHSVNGWKPIVGFDHAKTGFALTGAHRGAACLSCHVGQRWKGLPTTCYACHAKDDAHKGSRGTNCASCHATSAWAATNFNHDTMTRFPLTGAHDRVSCAGCHGAGNAIKKPPVACIGCHAKDDVHKGQNGTNCASCHNSRGWKQTSFDHDRMTRFPLVGAHERVACEGCHKQPPREVKPPVTCNGCHATDDIHKGNNGPDCASCHNATSWKQVSFDHNRMTKFPLLGAHLRTKCETCHTKPPRELKLSVACDSCHAKDDVHSGHFGGSCQNCHNFEDWKSRVAFDHGLTRFPLFGKHAAAKCTSCHADKTFRAKGITCQSCHDDDHHLGTLGVKPACGTCHNASDWKVWRFDHDTQTKFALTGKHQGLICSACHVRAGDPAKAPTECYACHRRNDIHHGGFGTDCQRCHTTRSFSEIIM
jgi:hypothetical protein